MEKRINKQKICPQCKKESANLWFDKFERSIFRCSSCNHVFVLLDKEMLKATINSYDNGDFFIKDDNESYYFEDTNIFSMKHKLNWVNQFCKTKGDLLDIGAGFGHFLKIAQNQFKSEGMDISSYAVEWSKRNFSVNNTVASIEQLPDSYTEKYDIITMWDVIEHLSSWEKALYNTVKALKPGGLMFLTTPDSSSISAKLLGKHWYYLDTMQHFSIFNKKNLVNILMSNGFEILDLRYVGRYYKVKYILDRLLYLNSARHIRPLIKVIKKATSPFENKSVYISMRDVLGICARKKG